jgi:hypothetical protein
VSENYTEEIAAVLPRLASRRTKALERLEEGEAIVNAARQELDAVDAATESIERLLGQSANGAAPAPSASSAVEITARAGPSVSGRHGRPRRSTSGVLGWQAVEQVLRAAPTGLTLDELAARVATLGYRPETDKPVRAVRAAANRLRERNHDFDYIAKRYVYRPQHVDAAGRLIERADAAQASLAEEEPPTGEAGA